jgi:hypothetical protein
MQRKPMNDIRRSVRRPSPRPSVVVDTSLKKDAISKISDSVSVFPEKDESRPSGSDFFAYVKTDKGNKRRLRHTTDVKQKRSSSTKASGMAVSSDIFKEHESRVDTKKDNIDTYTVLQSNTPFTPVQWNHPGAASRAHRGIWLVAVVAIVGFVIVVMNMFVGATVTIIPKQENAFIEGTFTAIRGGNAGDETAISFEIMDLTTQESTQIPATTEQQSERRASGTIVVYNNYNTSEQRLVKKTRFEDDKGHVYRINESIVVPGIHTEEGKTVPGSLEVTVYADEPGEEYNIGLADFTLPGFKGTSQYNKIYARSKTLMTGGFIGMEKIASDADIATTRATLEKTLMDTLLIDARNQTPEGSIFAEYTSAYTFEHVDPVPSDDGKNVILVSKGTLHAMIFDGAELARFIARRSIASYDDAEIYFSNPSQLTIGVVPTEGDTANALTSKITVSLGGTPHIVWAIDKKEIIFALLGTSRKKFDEIMNAFPGIASAKASLHPFWNGEFPQDEKDILVVQIIDGKEVK